MWKVRQGSEEELMGVADGVMENFKRLQSLGCGVWCVGERGDWFERTAGRYRRVIEVYQINE